MEDQIQEKVVEIRADLVSDFQRLALLVTHHQQLARQFQEELYKLVQVGHGIDLHQPGWMLDVISGRVYRHEPAKPTPLQVVKSEPEPETEQEGA